MQARLLLPLALLLLPACGRPARDRERPVVVTPEAAAAMAADRPERLLLPLALLLLPACGRPAR